MKTGQKDEDHLCFSFRSYAKSYSMMTQSEFRQVKTFASSMNVIEWIAIQCVKAITNPVIYLARIKKR